MTGLRPRRSSGGTEHLHRRLAARLAGARAGWPRALTADAGFTLIEGLVATALVLVVVGGPLAFIVFSLKQQNVSSSRAVAADQGRVGLQRLARDLRSAMSQNASGSPLTVVASTATGPPASSQILFSIPTPGADTTPQSVSWLCTVGATCTRSVNGGPGVLEITGVTGVTLAPVDSAGSALALPATNPAYIAITVNLRVTSLLGGQTQAAPGAANPIIVQTGVDLRNFA